MNGMGIIKSNTSNNEFWEGHHRFEHWYRDNQVYFLTARVRGKFAAFSASEAQLIFWNTWDTYTAQFAFVPWVTTLMSNHYHSLGYLNRGTDLASMMKHIHGATAKRVNDLLPGRIVPFWIDSGHQNYFDGCIRDEVQCRRAFAYTLTQSVRHGICRDYRAYTNTRVTVELDRGIRRAIELKAFLKGVGYPRYDRKKRS
jgi:hypothetical protein